MKEDEVKDYIIFFVGGVCILLGRKVHCTEERICNAAFVTCDAHFYFDLRFFVCVPLFNFTPRINASFPSVMWICVTCYHSLAFAHLKLMIIMKETSKTLFITILKRQLKCELKIHTHGKMEHRFAPLQCSVGMIRFEFYFTSLS